MFFFSLHLELDDTVLVIFTHYLVSVIFLFFLLLFLSSVHMYSLFLCYSLSIPHILCFLSGQKLLRLFSSKVYCLCLTACVWCILALWALSTSLLFCLLQADTPLSYFLFISLHSYCTPHQLLNRFHRKHKKGHSAVHSAEAASQTYSCSFLKFKYPTHPVARGM